MDKKKKTGCDRPQTVNEAVKLVREIFPGAQLVAARPEGSTDPPQDSDQWAEMMLTLWERPCP